MNKALALALTAVLAFGAAAQADLDLGDPISITGQALPQFGAPFWGTGATGGLDNGQPHAYGGSSTYADSVSGPGFTVGVTSSVISASSGSITVDYSGFGPGDFTTHTITCVLKNDGSISAVTLAGVGTVTANANGFTWTGTGAALTGSPTLTFTWTQVVPGPASLALLGAAGLVSRRRRR